ncbi:MAG TPA: glucan biosynthesis protein [Opitutaceae bacterium]|nr:glucan biosynthesis protein [Opitutaceae bacterium]
MKRLTSQARVALLGLVLLANFARASDEMFDFETLRYRAKMLAAKPYVPPPNQVPEWMRKLNYDQHRIIEFVADRSLWRREALPFEAQFFHPGYIFDKTVSLFELRGKRAEPIPFRRDYFDYHTVTVGEIPDELGFAGFRLLYPLNHAGDELGAFLGASYFRFLCQRSGYGLSARGLAIDTGGPGAEEFPLFTEFWLERPAPNAKTMNVFALLDSPSVTGAYRFTIAPGADTTMQIRAVLYARKNIAVFGVAPLTSMFWRGENSEGRGEDFRPEVHDSDGLLLNTGAGEWLWRPLANPRAMRSATFNDENPRGFGLLQRDRNFENYQDLEARYQLRPSAWVEPVGKWGRGGVRLVELPTRDEFGDNIVAFWMPAQLPPPGEPIELEYRLHWCMDQIRPPAGFASATRHSHEYETERFLVDFDGGYLNRHGDDPTIEPVVSVGEGAELTHTAVQKNPFNGSWRVTFVVKPDGSGRPVDLRCFLRKPPHVLTETWSYLWQP